MKSLAGWTGFLLKSVVSFIAVMAAVIVLAKYYPTLSELWFMALAVSIFSVIITVLAAGRAQEEEDRRMSED